MATKNSLNIALDGSLSITEARKDEGKEWPLSIFLTP